MCFRSKCYWGDMATFYSRPMYLFSTLELIPAFRSPFSFTNTKPNHLLWSPVKYFFLGEAWIEPLGQDDYPFLSPSPQVLPYQTSYGDCLWFLT